MRVTKILEVQLDLQNPIDIHADLDGNLMSILVAEYERKCFRACYILRVVRVIRHSDCVFAQEGGRVNGKMNVMFEVEAIVYSRDEILTGCVVTMKDKHGVIFASAPLASVFMNAHSTTESITVGQVITVRVGAAEYRHGATTVTVNAIPYLPSTAYNVYRVGELSPSDRALVAEHLRQYNDEVELSRKTREANPKGWEFFEKITYAYKTEQQTPAAAVAVDITGAFDTPGYFSHDPRIGLRPMFYRYQKPGDAVNATYMQQLTSAMSAIALLVSATASLRATREMLTVYNTEDLLSRHKNVWLSYQRAKN